ncbi:hypothetical protein RHGRI_025678 [Rhododendron griersonianum]|uniref:Uncharacterized protein n=1 Tax=Rhododendron griersonianum TaxID=479676 RepID=A0AAV6IW20_9ERIC|nr:hypothetical protein RHGRI_025678 [Rhododendron griersonianum]
MRTATFLEYPCFIDMLALCTGMRPVIMVDYGGKMPELQEHLCGVLKLSQKESSMFENLRVMVIEDMIYLIHIKWLAEFVRSSLNSETELLFADLEQDPPKMITHAEESSVAMELVSVQKWFSLIFPVDRMNSDPLPSHRIDSMSSGKSRIEELVMSQSSELIDLSRCMQETEITIPTLNGWLLGYPIVYLFSKEHISDAIYNLSTKSLHLFKVLVRSCFFPSVRSRSCQYFSQYQIDMLAETMGRISDNDINSDDIPGKMCSVTIVMSYCKNIVNIIKNASNSFSVPYELSLEGRNEPWAETFISQMRAKWERCKQVWGSLHMEVSSCYPQAIVL